MRRSSTRLALLLLPASCSLAAAAVCSAQLELTWQLATCLLACSLLACPACPPLLAAHA